MQFIVVDYPLSSLGEADQCFGLEARSIMFAGIDTGQVEIRINASGGDFSLRWIGIILGNPV